MKHVFALFESLHKLKKIKTRHTYTYFSYLLFKNVNLKMYRTVVLRLLYRCATWSVRPQENLGGECLGP